MKKFFIMLMFLLPMIGLHACDTCGFFDDNEQKVFSVRGFDPNTNSEYTGVAVITRSGEVFSVQWTFDNGTSEIGTGIKIGKQLSVGFADADTLANPGVKVYEVICNNELVGRWVPIGGSLVGEETLKRIH